MTRRCWLAWAVSLAGHGAIVLGIAQLCAFRQHSQTSPKVAVNRVIAPPEQYCSISVSFAEEPSKPNPTPSQPKADPPKQRDNPPAPKSISNQSSPAAPIAKDNPGPSGLVQTGHHATGVAPLHGRIDSRGTSIVYVIDQSASMARGGKLKNAIAMLKASLRQLGPEVRFQIVTYDSVAMIARIGGSSQLVEAGDANIVQAESLLDAVVGEGSSRHADGLIAGLGLHPSVLILLTDADELSPAQIARIKLWNRHGTAIHAVILGDGKPSRSSSLRELTGPDRLHFVP